DAMIFVSSCGIVVRKIAPYINDKSTDPAVICVDDSGKYVIPVLSGHIGGANDLARKIADKLCAAAVITTATDINNRFAVDSWAAKQGFVIDDMTLAKDVSAEILERDVPVVCDFCTLSDYPKGLKAGKNGRIGIYIGWNKKTPFEKTLRIIPPVLHLGIGCRRGTKAESIRSAVNEILNAYDIDKRAIKYVASINLKSKEDGLLEYCRENGWEIYFYTADELQSLQGDFTASSFVREITGIDNVCERAAMMGAKSLIVKKTAVNGVTAAVAAENTEVRFE
ncbi:MAG: cobalamin biosynthesis protein, partial [Clostridia bacterium]|nr:cobalamin biosynthesis protein [Clostridia bacterium]